MNASFRREIVFSEHASVSLFECLIVAGAPATGLFQSTIFKDGDTLQTTLQLLRNMWRRADTLYIPRVDLESLHHMECNSVLCQDTRIPARIASETRKLSRYYIYLLFRYCLSSAGPMTYNQKQGFMSNCLIRMSQKNAAPLVDVPGDWLETEVCSNYPSAPPIPDCNFVSGGMTSLLPQQFPSDLHQQQQQQPPPQGECHQDMTHTMIQRLPLQPNTKQMYPDLTHHQSGELLHTKAFKGSNKKPRMKNVLSKGCYNSNVESDEEY